MNPDGTVMQMEGAMDGQGNLAPSLAPGMHMSAMMAADGTPLQPGEAGTPGEQAIVGGTPKTGKSSARRSHTRWTESETMRLVDGAPPQQAARSSCGGLCPAHGTAPQYLRHHHDPFM